MYMVAVEACFRPAEQGCYALMYSQIDVGTRICGYPQSPGTEKNIRRDQKYVIVFVRNITEWNLACKLPERIRRCFEICRVFVFRCAEPAEGASK